jgi:NADPH:quinone reductase-like Zn-dependent oxidoreductase
MNGNLNYQDYIRMGHRGVMVGFTNMTHMMSILLKNAISKFPLAHFTAEAKSKDLEILAQLIHTGKIKVHLNGVYPSNEIPQAIGFIESMRTTGKVAIQWH